ncbi:MAG: nucleoside triphosphate pyrophosphohydrolase [Proteobacteria bacterium]|nr:nucleoside triphosphate pyrophosphohydrolase [Pseudomonadota bacterium]
MDGIKALIDVMAKLRDPNGGCPWDLEQTFESITPYTIEEAYEVADAVERGDMADFKEELGDLLLQVVFHSQMAEEEGLFDVNEVAQAEADKLISRHPHVFGDKTAKDAAAVVDIWNAQKDKEKKDKGQTHLLDGVTKGLPALMRAQKIHRKVAKVGFDWPSTDDVFEKMAEEVAELKQAVANKDQDNLVEELGDILFVACVLAEHLGVDAETALRNANNKFINRFNKVEDLMKVNSKEFGKTSLEQMDEYWNMVKAEEKSAA